MPFFIYWIYKLSIRTATVNDGGRFENAPTGMGAGGNMRNPAGKIRKFFPETWIWDLIPVGYVSCTMAVLFLSKAVFFISQLVFAEKKQMRILGCLHNVQPFFGTICQFGLLYITVYMAQSF